MNHFYPKPAIKSIDDIVRRWSRKAQTIAYSMVEKYGMPHETTPSMLIWYHNGPWKQTIVHSRGAQHNFPATHIDLLEQVVDYWIPLEKVDELIAFDGSIRIDKTKGELSVCCDDEANNYVALNLAHDIVLGKKTAQEARDKYAHIISGMKSNWKDPYAERLNFEVPEDNETATADPDHSVVSKNLMRRIGEKFGL